MHHTGFSFLTQCLFPRLVLTLQLLTVRCKTSHPEWGLYCTHFRQSTGMSKFIQVKGEARIQTWKQTFKLETSCRSSTGFLQLHYPSQSQQHRNPGTGIWSMRNGEALLPWVREGMRRQNHSVPCLSRSPQKTFGEGTELHSEPFFLVSNCAN